MRFCIAVSLAKYLCKIVCVICSMGNVEQKHRMHVGYSKTLRLFKFIVFHICLYAMFKGFECLRCQFSGSGPEEGQFQCLCFHHIVVILVVWPNNDSILGDI